MYTRKQDIFQRLRKDFAGSERQWGESRELSGSERRRNILRCAGVRFVRITQAFKLYNILHLVTASMFARQDVGLD
jgi:hypothetical protein